MRNPFKKHTEEHEDIWDILRDVTFQYALLRETVEELREEVDYLVDFLDD